VSGTCAICDKFIDGTISGVCHNPRFRCMNQGIYSWTGPGDNNKHQINLVYG
jgi:hypothetical protein